ncbi:MAG: protein kinase [Planctomycetes bacterium]|nr:protein kinase [Planctomycetota bacterium]
MGKCLIERELGRGGMGAVYLARHMVLQVPVAVKVLPPHLAAQSPQYALRFLQEARLAARLRHAHAVQVMDADLDEETGLHYIVFEYVDGGTVGDLLRQGPLVEGEALRIVEQVAEALVAAAEFGIVHRDIKPANILLTLRGEAKLSDLGLAKDLLSEGQGMTLSSSAMGSPFYMSPEQVKNARDVDARTDFYSLGATLYHLLTGERPFNDASVYQVFHLVVNEPAPDPRARQPQVSEPVARLCLKLMDKDRRHRPASAVELLDEIRRIPARPGLATPGGKPTDTPGPVRPAAAETPATVLLREEMARRALAPTRTSADAQAEGAAPPVGPAPGSNSAARRARHALAVGMVLVLLAGIILVWTLSTARRPASAPTPAISPSPGPPSPVGSSVPPGPETSTSGPETPLPVSTFRMPDGVLLAFSFDEGTLEMEADPRRVRDLSGNGNHGTVYNAGLEPGRIGQALRFNGMDAAVEAPALDERTVCLWVQPDQQIQMGFYDGGTMNQPYRAFEIGIYEPRGFPRDFATTFGLFLGFWWVDADVPSPGIASGWHHVAVAWDGESRVRLAVDGQFPEGHVVLADDASDRPRGPQPLSLPRPPQPDRQETTLIGRIRAPFWGNGQDHFSGLIDEVAVWGRALSPEEIVALYRFSEGGGSYCSEAGVRRSE